VFQLAYGYERESLTDDRNGTSSGTSGGTTNGTSSTNPAGKKSGCELSARPQLLATLIGAGLLIASIS